MVELIGRFGKGQEIRLEMSSVRLAVVLLIEKVGSVAAAAEKSGLNRNTLRNYRAGSHVPYLHKLGQLANALGIPVDWME